MGRPFGGMPWNKGMIGEYKLGPMSPERKIWLSKKAKGTPRVAALILLNKNRTVLHRLHISESAKRRYAILRQFQSPKPKPKPKPKPRKNQKGRKITWGAAISKARKGIVGKPRPYIVELLSGRFGNWFVLGRAGTRGSFSSCRCNCGRVYSVNNWKLKNKQSTKCVVCSRKGPTVEARKKLSIVNKDQTPWLKGLNSQERLLYMAKVNLRKIKELAAVSPGVFESLFERSLS